MRASVPVGPRRLLAAGALLGLLAGLACSQGTPVWCAAALPDGGCSYHVEVHCGGAAECSPGSTEVLDAGSCERDAAADVLGC